MVEGIRPGDMREPIGVGELKGIKSMLGYGPGCDIYDKRWVYVARKDPGGSARRGKRKRFWQEVLPETT